MKNFNKFFSAIIVAIAVLSACSKENEQPAFEISEDEVISRTGLLLEASQEVPPKDTKACGTFDISYNKTTKILTFTLNWTDLSGIPTGAHIHGIAPRGINAGIKYDFFDLIPKTTSGTFTGTVLVDEAAIFEKELLAGLYYFNMHTPLNPGGEIRGQIEFTKPEIVSRKGALLEGAQEVPAKNTGACGTFDVSYNKTNKVLTYTINWTGLSGIPTGAHIHGEAARGVNAPIKHDFFALIPKVITGSFTNWVVVDEVALKEPALLDGLYYFNMHTPLNPGGEIRGQIEFKK
ncbi:CHRD domain-containing protein [Flavihumibacter sp. R14]|nr:CHRD domain-containing protein [Flavihumibacter soli]